jgi:hypothetical protein
MANNQDRKGGKQQDGASGEGRQQEQQDGGRGQPGGDNRSGGREQSGGGKQSR